jgi:membrane associated rhomboid family serine protease
VIPIKDNIPNGRFPLVTLALMLANFVAYVLAVGHGGSLISGPDTHEIVKYGAIPYALTHPGKHCGLATAAKLGTQTIACQGQRGGFGAPTGVLPTWETAFTAMFMHASILHIGGNMLFLWIFGNSVEDSMGRWKFLGFYILGGLAALLLQVVVGPNSSSPTVGASGAIAAVLGGYIVLYPRARVLTLVFIILFFTVIALPALVMLGLWFAEQTVFAAAGLTNPTGGGGGVAYFAHVGGFVFGALTIRRLATRGNRSPPTPPAPPSRAGVAY